MTCLPLQIGALCIGISFGGADKAPATAGAKFCDVAQPIIWSAQDTRRTKEQVDEHNRVGKSLCGWGAKK